MFPKNLHLKYYHCLLEVLSADVSFLQQKKLLRVHCSRHAGFFGPDLKWYHVPLGIELTLTKKFMYLELEQNQKLELT